MGFVDCMVTVGAGNAYSGVALGAGELDGLEEGDALEDGEALGLALDEGEAVGEELDEGLVVGGEPELPLPSHPPMTAAKAMSVAAKAKPLARMICTPFGTLIIFFGAVQVTI